MTTPNQPPDLERRLERIEADLRRYGNRLDNPGYQLVDGVPFFPGGIQLGGGSRAPIFEPFDVPPALNASATWGSSFDTIYIDVTWSPPTAYGAEVVSGYTVQAFKSGETIPIEVSTLGTTTHVRIEPVEPNTTYTIRVYAHTKTDRMSAPATVTITTGADTNPPGPVTFGTNPVLPGLQSLAIKWNANTERDVANGAGLYRVIISTASNLSAPVRDFKQAGTQIFVTGLEPATAYYVGVAAVDSSGNQGPVSQPTGGPWTPSPIVTTDIALAVGGGNIVKNSSFEVEGQWTVASGTWSLDATTTRFGGKSVKIDPSSADAYMYQDFTLFRGKWILSAWAKAQSVAIPAGFPGTGVVLNVDALSGTVVAVRALMGGTASTTDARDVVLGVGTFDWKRAATLFEVTSATALVRIYVQRGYGGACTGTVWWDGVQLEQGDTITAYAPRPDEILPGTITTVEIADDSITAPKIVTGSIVAGKIAANAVGAVEIAARSIIANRIAVDAITSSEIATGAVTANEISANAITADKIAANAITAAKIAAETITADKLAVTMGISVGKVIQSANYIGGSSGWRISGDGNAEFQNAVIRGSTWGGGSINIANRLVASIGDPTVHLAANVEMGSGYSGSLFSGDLNWGIQVGNSGGGGRWAHLQGHLVPPNDYVIGFYDAYRARRLLYADTSASVWKPGPDGNLWAEKVAQNGDWGTQALIVRNGSTFMNEGNLDTAGMAFHVRAWNNATVLQMVGPTGSGLEVHQADNTGWAPVRASAFLVVSASDTKSNIEDLPLADSKLDQLRPVTFNRPPSMCAICHNTRKIKAPEPDTSVELVPDEHGVKPELPMLPIGSPCPYHSGAKKWKRSKAQERYEDSKFVGLVAEDVAAVHPELVGWRQTASGPVPDSIDYGGLIALLIAEVQEIKKTLNTEEQ